MREAQNRTSQGVWGRVAGVLATATAALVFAFVLFNPVRSWIVNDDAARTNLGWMMLGGTALSYLWESGGKGRSLPNNVLHRSEGRLNIEIINRHKLHYPRWALD